MQWGNFSLIHFITLFLGVALNVGLYFIVKKMSPKAQKIIFFCISLLGIGAILFNLLSWESPIEYLPLHLCSLNALVLPIVAITKNKELGNLLLLWALGALFALIVNNSAAEFEIFSWTFFFYYFPHVFECGLPIVMIAINYFKKDSRCISSTLIITFVVYTIIHFINIGLNNYVIENNILDNYGNYIKLNYMFSITPENPLLALLYSIVPYSYWYMLLVIPIIAIYLLVIYLPELKIEIKNKRLLKTKDK